MAWSMGHFAHIFSMWSSIMVAMMAPASAPMILLYARVAKQANADAQPATGLFLAVISSPGEAFHLSPPYCSECLVVLAVVEAMIVAQ
jgi:predicted metal-binding membrane protein